MKKVDLLLVNPGNRMEQFASLNTLATVAPPLGIAMVGAYARQEGIRVAVIDAEAEFWTPDMTIEAIKEYDPLIVGLSAFTTKMHAAEQIMKLVKEWRPDVYTLIGGHHSSAIPEETARTWYIDYVLAGEGYESIVSLVRELKDGNTNPSIEGIWYDEGDVIHKAGMASYTRDIDSLPYPAWDLLPMDKYRAHHWQ